jgi:hypothetical protein
MLRLEGKHTEVHEQSAHRHLSEGEGLLFLCVLAGSWLIAIGVAWVLWRMAPL